MAAFALANPTNTRRGRTAGLLSAVVLSHALLLYLLIQVGVLPVPAGLPVLQVSLITAPAPEPEPKVDAVPKPKTPPRPAPPVKAAQPAPVPIAPVLATAAAESPVPATVPILPAQPAAAETAANAGAPTQSASVSAPVIPPRFDADYLDNPQPPYPPMARRQNQEGRVVLRVVVEPDGRASAVSVKTSSGFSLLDDAAMAAVSKWKFVPARRGNDAVSAAVLVPIRFSLRD